MNKNQKTMKYINKAFELLKQGSDNQAVWALCCARNVYDGLSGIAMEDVFEIIGITDWATALDILQSVIDNSSKTKSQISKIKKQMKEIQANHKKSNFVISVEPETPKLSKVYPLKHNTIIKLAKTMKKVVNNPPYLYKFSAHNDSNSAWGVQDASEGLINYALEHNKTKIPKANHLAESDNVFNHLDLIFNKSNQDVLKNDLIKLSDYQVIKLIHKNKQLRAVAPTLNDIDKTITDMSK